MSSKKDKLRAKMPKFEKKNTSICDYPQPCYVQKTPEERKENWDREIKYGKEFYNQLESNSIPTEIRGTTRNFACVKRDELVDFLFVKTNTVAAVMGASKRKLALAGKVTKKGVGRAIIYDKESDMICFDTSRIEDAPGVTIYDKVVYSKAATQGPEKFSSLIKALKTAGCEVTITERDVRKWLEDTGRFTGKKKPSRRG